MKVHRQRLRRQHPSNVDVTAFLSLMVILVPFLLISAVFSRITILELQGSSSGQDRHAADDPLRLRVVVRGAAIEVHYLGQDKPVRFARTPGAEELVPLARLLEDLKTRHPQSSQATILLEPQIPYDVVVQVMDAVRVKPRRPGSAGETRELFPRLALGETPVADDHRDGHAK